METPASCFLLLMCESPILNNLALDMLLKSQEPQSEDFLMKKKTYYEIKIPNSIAIHFSVNVEL